MEQLGACEQRKPLKLVPVYNKITFMKILRPYSSNQNRLKHINYIFYIRVRLLGGTLYLGTCTEHGYV